MHDLNSFKVPRTLSLKIIELLQTRPLKLFYRIFVLKIIRKKIQKYYDLEYDRILAKEIVYLNKKLRNKDESFIRKYVYPTNILNTEKIIWQYWGQGIDSKILPVIVERCFESVNKNSDDYIVIRIDDKNIGNYLQIPDFIVNKYIKVKHGRTFFSDFVRVALLYFYGGIWVDATIYLTAPIKKSILNSELFMFSRDPKALNKDICRRFSDAYFSWEKDHRVNILSSFIVAKQNNELMKDLLVSLLAYWHNEKTFPRYFFFQVMIDALMKNKKYKFKTEDDTLPHLLQLCWLETFNQKYWDEICLQTDIHKLTYKVNVSNLTNVEDSYYQCLINRQL